MPLKPGKGTELHLTRTMARSIPFLTSSALIKFSNEVNELLQTEPYEKWNETQRIFRQKNTNHTAKNYKGKKNVAVDAPPMKTMDNNVPLEESHSDTTNPSTPVFLLDTLLTSA